MTADQKAIAWKKHVEQEWPLAGAAPVYHCNLRSSHSDAAAKGIFLGWTDPQTGIVYKEGCLVNQVDAKWTKPTALLLII